ncbi:unnamed protein product [Linum tenue]|uniref:Pentatricopeptide repeat-containing protein n=1 Tax=Linum tenue TaxID=586396 RepID=A0AAV0MN68_9ROSI|nr:unnamed protein product [Linum tenue]
MAIRAFISSLRRVELHYEARFLSSVASPSHVAGRGSLKDKDSRLRFPSGESPTTLLKNWTNEGRKIAVSELKRKYKKLLGAKRYRDALEILEWMEIHSKNQMSVEDYANGLELTLRMRGITKAEEYFERLPSSASRKAAFLPILCSYVRQRDAAKAEAFMVKMNEKGGNPNYKTWEILIEGWVKTQKMDKAVSAMKKGLSRLKSCHWRPSENILMPIAEYFEQQGNLEEANDYLRIIHHLGVSSLPLYKLLLRFHLQAQKPVPHILSMMEKDEIEMDDEITALVRASTSGANCNQ